MSLPVPRPQTTDMMRTWTLSTGSRGLLSRSFIKSQPLKRTKSREKWRCFSCRESWEAGPSKTSCMKVKKRDLRWLRNCWLSPRFPTCPKTKPNKSCSSNIKKSSKTPCMKAFKVKSSPRPLTNCQRNCSDTLKRRELRKRSKRQRMKDARDKFRKLVVETPNKSSAPVNNACTKKSSKWTKAQSTVTSTGSSTTPWNEPLTARRASWPTCASKKWTSTWRATRGGSTTTRPWSGTWCNRSCCRMYREAGCRRRCSWSRDGSRRRQRSRCTRRSPRRRPSWWRRRRNDDRR